MSEICNVARAFAVFAVAPALLAAQATPPPPRVPLAITGVTVVDVEAGRLEPARTVFVSDGRITGVVPAGSPVPRGVTVIPGDGGYLVPGLWDMHVHLAAVPIRPGRGRDITFDDNADWNFPLLLANGVTGVRDMSGPFRVLRTWRDEILAGSRAGPRIVHTGWKLEGNEPVVPHAPRHPHNEAEIRRSIEMLDSAGADFVKVESMRPELLRQAIAIAGEHQLRVVGHVGPWMSARQASALGLRSIEHLQQVLASGARAEEAVLASADREFSWWGAYLVRWGWWDRAERRRERLELTLETWDSTRAMTVFAEFAAAATWQTPTLTGLRDQLRVRPAVPAERMAWLPPAVLSRDAGDQRPSAADSAFSARHQALQYRVVRMMAAAGVPILAGSDSPGTRRVPGAALVEELEELVRAGLTPLEALQAATIGPARFLEATDSLGTVAPGKVADLVLVDGNPLAEIGALRRVRAVVAGGRYYPRADLDRRLAEVQAVLTRLRSLAAPSAAATAEAGPGSTP